MSGNGESFLLLYQLSDPSIIELSDIPFARQILIISFPDFLAEESPSLNSRSEIIKYPLSFRAAITESRLDLNTCFEDR